jgi:hypothetical protein
MMKIAKSSSKSDWTVFTFMLDHSYENMQYPHSLYVMKSEKNETLHYIFHLLSFAKRLSIDVMPKRRSDCFVFIYGICLALTYEHHLGNKMKCDKL